MVWHLLLRLMVVCAYFNSIYCIYQEIKAEEVNQEKIGVTVFVHGTVGSVFGANSEGASSDVLYENRWAVQFVKKYRNYPFMGYDQILGQEGLHEFVPENIECWQASRYLIPAYADIMQMSKMANSIQKYAIFGWSGLFHYGARKQDGYELYHALCAYRETLFQRYGKESEFTLIAHSHGGNVALWLADAEKQFKQGLHVKTLVMFGTPMECSMAPCIESPLFSTIILCHSDGDNVQMRDRYSTKDKKSYRRLADVADISNPLGNTRRIDIRCVVDGKSRRITHANMWMVGRSIYIAPDYYLLPFMLFSPFIIKLVGHLDDTVYAEFHVCVDDENCTIQMACSPIDWSSVALHNLLYNWNCRMQNEWRDPNDRMRNPIFNRKSIKAMLHTFFCK